VTACLEYQRMTLPQLKELDRSSTVFFISVSPIEVHGPHLPTGTDVTVSLELQRRYIDELSRRHPEMTMVTLPPLYVGSDALPVKGSLSVPAVALRTVLLAYAKGLAAQGFKYLFIADNHGGPRHQMAFEWASRKVWKKYRFYMINPFLIEFRMMCHQDAAFLSETGLGPGTCGDDADAHAGTNETSLMLVADPEAVGNYKETPPSLPQKAKLRLVSGMVGALGGSRVKRDMEHLGATLGWVGDRNMMPYMGDPSRANAEAGEAMLKARVNIALNLFEKALAGERPDTAPMLWWLSPMMRLPE
jgi:creatinine amidohydrolase